MQKELSLEILVWLAVSWRILSCYCATTDDNPTRRHKGKYQKPHSLFKQFVFQGMDCDGRFQILRQQIKVNKGLLLCSIEAADTVLAEEKKKSLCCIWYIMNKTFMEAPGLF